MIVRKARIHLALPLAAVVVAAAATGAVATTTASTTSAPPASAPALNAASVAAQYAVPGTVLGSGGWQVLSSAKTSSSGAKISAPSFSTSGWLGVTNDDGGAPGTEIEALLQNGGCPNVYYSTNMKSCFGYESKVGADTVAQFDVPWWYRTNFTSNLASGQHASLVVNGVVGAADVWVDGKEVATQSTVEGAYTRYTFDVTGDLTQGTNTLALEVYPNNPSTMLTVDDVDWNQVPPDNNTGIQLPVQLLTSNALSDADAHVVENNASDLSSSAITVKTNVTNNTSSSQTGVVDATITPPNGGSPISLTQNVTVAANSTQTVSFTPANYSALTISHPAVWWPYQMGAQPLYGLTTSVSQGSTVSTSTTGTFGIRNVTSSLVGAGSVDENGVRQYKINGVAFVARGGGFAPDLFLHYSASDIAKQIAILKNMGVNMIRLEGHFMPDDFYQQMDQAGIMIDSGYQCCDAWGNSLSGNLLTVATNSALAIGQNEVDHPSVVTFSWSDNAPGSADTKDTLASFAQADFDVPVVASAEENSVSPLGDSGEKEGPYDWVPPNYWYDTTHSQPNDNQTNAGGSWGFDSEQSAGDTIPTLDSINRFMSSSEQSELWQSPTYNQYHANYETGHGDYEFGTLYNFDQAMNNRFGTPTSLNQYVEDGQVQDYENTRAQFEAFLDHSTNSSTPSTGTLYWQLNKGWPSLLWNLYNEDGDQAGSYYGTKEANQNLHALYTLDNGTVTLDNLGGTTQSGLSVESKVYNTSGSVLDDQTAGSISLSAQQVKNKVLTPKVPATVTGKSSASTYFVELTLKQNGNVVDRNVYWESTYPDKVDWTSTMNGDNADSYATMTQYANLQGLNSLAAGSVSATNVTTSSAAGPDGSNTVTNVTLTNTSSKTVGFFLRTDLRRGNASGTPQSGDNEVASALWSDNDITLFPGESQTVSVTYKASDLNGATPVISLSGWNVAAQDVAAPSTSGGSGGGSAENNAYSADKATIGGSAYANSCSHCLDKEKVSGIGGSGNGTVTFTGVSETTAGTYPMTVYYLSVGSAHPAVITVNGVAQTVSFAESSATSYSVIGTATVQVTLNAGANTIEFSGSAGGAAPDLDHIVV